MQTELRAKLAASKSQGQKATEDFFDWLKNVGDDSEVVAFLLSILEETKANESDLVPSLAAIELARRRKSDILPRLKNIRGHLPHIGMFNADYRIWSVDLAIAILEGARAGRQCNCETYARCRSGPYWDDMNVTQEVVRGDGSFIDISVVCKICQQEWKVEEDTRYHFSYYQWEKIKTSKR